MKVLYNNENEEDNYSIKRYIRNSTKEHATVIEEFTDENGKTINEIDIYIDELKLIANELGYEVVKK